MSVSSNPSVGYMRQRNGSTFVQEMACALFGAKPLPELVLVYCRLDSWEQISVKSHYSGVIMSTMAFRITGISIVGKSLVTGDFPAQRASNAENVSIWWRIMSSWNSIIFIQENACEIVVCQNGGHFVPWETSWYKRNKWIRALKIKTC